MSPPDSLPISASHPPLKNGAPLAERSRSQMNKPSLRLLHDSPDEGTPTLYASTPFPTKPAQVLLPSALRERRLGSNDENNVPGAGLSGRFAAANTKVKRLGSDATPDGRLLNPTPTLTLKKSVKALRDLYEAQAERSSPSTATSPVTSPLLRPSTAGSGVRSFGSRDGPKGPQAWELFHKAYSDEVGSLPSLDEVAATVRQIESQTYLTAPEPSTPTPHLVTEPNPSGLPMRPITKSSSPEVEIIEQSYSSGDTAVGSSSPNLVRLAGSSSPTATSADPSSPNVVKLGSSSPSYNAPGHPDIAEELDQSPDTVRRSLVLAEDARARDGPSFAARMQNSDGFASSPPEPVSSSPIASSAVDSSTANTPYPASSPPFETITMASERSDESGSLSHDVSIPRTHRASASHTSLQIALGSSPAPNIQYPTIRAPRFTEPMTLRVAKRSSRSIADRFNEKWDPRLSTVPSEWSGEHEVLAGQMSVDHGTSTDSETSDDDSLLQPPARAYLASSREASGSTIRMVSEADRREATDFIADLPPSDYRTPQLQQRSSGLLSMISSSGSRSSSLRNSFDTRLNSIRSFTSSRHNSFTRSIRRPGSSSSLVSNLPIPTWARRYYSGNVPKEYFYSASQISSTTTLPQRPSTSTPRTPVEHVTSIFRPRTRPRLPPPRQSHLVPGVGPLVSHPVYPRPVSIALDPADPRAHWAGTEETALPGAQGADQGELIPPHSPYRLFPNRREWSPHLHPDLRAPGRSFWRAPSMNEDGETLLNWRNAQVLGFILGFVFPVSWFVAAFALPLPPKPTLDMEQMNHVPTPTVEARIQQEMDIDADRRWENARWWRGLNRVMCVLGVMVIVLVITLAAVYH